MGPVERVERAVLRAALGLPDGVQRRLAGRPVVLDGNRLATDVQLMLRVQRIAREKGAERMPLAEGRAALVHHSRLVGGAQPIGQVRELTAGGRPARLYVPTAAGATGPMLVFFHGGGFMYGDLDSHDASCRFLAERAGVRILAVDYRLAPEHRFPAAYDDAVAAYQWAIDHAADLGTTPERIGVGGDSAGGNLSAGVAIEAARAGLPCVVQLLVYPASDGGRETVSVRLFGEGFYLTREFMDLANASYLGSPADLDDPRFSPARADLPAGLAPALVFTAGFDPIRDEGEAYAALLERAGAQVTLRRFADQIHGFFNIVGVGRTSLAAVTEIADGLRRTMSSPAA